MKRPSSSKIKRLPSTSSILGKKSYMNTSGERDYYDPSSEDSLMVVKKIVPSYLRISKSASNLRVKTSMQEEGKLSNDSSTLSASTSSNTTGRARKDLSRPSSASVLLKIPTPSFIMITTKTVLPKMVIPKPSFKNLAPEIIIRILEYYGGEFESCVYKEKLCGLNSSRHGKIYNDAIHFLYRNDVQR